MFLGTFQHAIDAKGRTSLPSKFRDALSAENSDRLIITTSPDEPCLYAYSVADWQTNVLQKVAAMPTFHDTTKHIARRFVAPAQECSVDKLGRILIPPSLREYAGLGEEVTWAGLGNRIEVWQSARWNELQKKSLEPENLAELKKALGTLAI